MIKLLRMFRQAVKSRYYCMIFGFLFILLFQFNAYADDSGVDWEATVAPILKQKLWKQETAYDATHYLMIPLHAAFLLENKDWQRDFHQHFNEFIIHKEELPEGLNGTLIRLHYLFFASRYLVFAQDSALTELSSFLLAELHRFWQTEPAWQWQRQPFVGGMRERLAWKLNQKITKPSYLRAIIDEELFLIGIAANLKSYLNRSEKIETSVIDEILNAAKIIFKNEVSWTKNGGWLLQPGVWADHPDYAYAGHDNIRHGMPKKPVSNISWDTSHSSRLPLFLRCLAESALSNNDDRQLYTDLLHALSKQFFEVILVSPTDNIVFFRTTNFMDGHNGLYRVAYHPAMNGNGYGPYALSGTPLLGWWIFLGDSKTHGLYENYLINLKTILDWLANVDPYGSKCWVFEENTMIVTPVILKLAQMLSHHIGNIN